ncbi:monovalent cation:H+ antiporter, CPA1 family [Arachidicoccus rhizosphaerae]|uniref:Monovalent cation:H+ antiporter, CPA1 family n=1 Tax=Arachidicoccus rhizosphaerae TaxID=551991 RepID=A0A1H3VKK1_9BACT|nr:Na+/H+ antiporter [Arachidicoccus rhizosphaerae]SDZ75300.1 monovalent cation:H+ antiporter, CPA1 family [Arachidicoccus rhizosphaerae]
MENISLIIILLFVIAFLWLLSKRFSFPFPIVLVLFGTLISLIPGLPTLTLSPDIIFLLFLPPLLYGAAWNTSWHDFRAAIRPISLAAIGLVLFTTVAVAVVAHYLIPSFGWPVAFLLGAIISPPDVISATAVTKGLGLHPGLLTILEGESLINDASALIAYRYALAAIMTTGFVWWEAGLNFLYVAAVGIAVGLAVAFIMRIIHERFSCDPVVDVTLTFLTPYSSYLIAEHFQASGVLAVVTTGLYLSFRSAKLFSHQGRIMTEAIWEVAMFILNGLIFILIGLQLRNVSQGLGQYSKGSLILYGLTISVLVILIRFVWILPSLIWPDRVGRSIYGDRGYERKNLMVFGWSGMRGIVSMAAAMALPLSFAGSHIFPHRNLLIFLTFCVILTTLVLLGLTLPWLIKVMKLEPYSVVAQEYEVRTKIVSEAIGKIEEQYSLLPDELLNNIKSKYEVKYNRLQKTALPSNYFGQGKTLTSQVFNQYTQVQLELLEVERNSVQQMHLKGSASESILKKIERELDVEETRLRMEMYES